MSGLHRTFLVMNLVGLSIFGVAASAHAESVDSADAQLADEHLGSQSEPEVMSRSAHLLMPQPSEPSSALAVQAENMASEQPVVPIGVGAAVGATSVPQMNGTMSASNAELDANAELNANVTSDVPLGEGTVEAVDEPATASAPFIPVSSTVRSPSSAEPTLQAQTYDDSDERDGSEQRPEPTLNDPVIQDDTPEPIFDDEPSSIEVETEIDDDDDDLFDSDDELLEDDPALDEEAETDPLDPDLSEFSPGRATRSGPSYVGIGGNIGLGDGDTALGEGSFAVFSKLGITSNLSLRPGVLVSDDPTILIPVTIDFIPFVTDATEDVTEDLGVRVSPFVGAGAAISTGDDSGVDFLATGGVDIGITDDITGLISVNASLFDNPAVGLLLGVGYNF